jgi:hypothetical protein
MRYPARVSPASDAVEAIASLSQISYRVTSRRRAE